MGPDALASAKSPKSRPDVEAVASGGVEVGRLRCPGDAPPPVLAAQVNGYGLFLLSKERLACRFTVFPPVMLCMDNTTNAYFSSGIRLGASHNDAQVS